MCRYKTIRKASDETGYTEEAINSKIKTGVWLEGRVWIKAPDGRRLIDMEGYEKWAESGSGTAFAPHRNPASGSTSLTRESDASSSSKSPLSANRPPIENHHRRIPDHQCSERPEISRADLVSGDGDNDGLDEQELIEAEQRDACSGERVEFLAAVVEDGAGAVPVHELQNGQRDGEQ